MQPPKILRAIGALFIATVSAVPITHNTTERGNSTEKTAAEATYFQIETAQWVSDTKLCSETSREHSGYINVDELDRRSSSLSTENCRELTRCR